MLSLSRPLSGTATTGLLTGVIALGMLGAPPAAAAMPRTAAAAEAGALAPVVGTDQRHDTSPSLRQMADRAGPGNQASADRVESAPPPKGAAPGVKQEHSAREIPRRLLPKAEKAAAPAAGGSARVQSTAAPTAAALPDFSANFEGMNNPNNVFPPDTNGDVGPDHYVQIVNSSMAVFDKHTGNRILGPVNNNVLWQGFGGACQTHNDGDPTVLYDSLANRWFVSQLALKAFSPTPDNFNHQCIAVSQTADPTGAYHRYDFRFSQDPNLCNDYPKFGVWPDAYYMTANQFTNNCLDPGVYAGVGAVAFQRDAILAGQPAQTVYFDVGQAGLQFGNQLPSDLDGRLPPPAGTPNLFVEADDNAFGFPTDQLNAWEFHVDWDHPANSTFGNNLQPNFTIDTAPFDSNLCAFSRNCIPQPSTAVRLDAISDRVLFRLAYRNFGDHQSLVVNHTVDTNGADHAGIRWYELRSTNGGDAWSMFQQGTYAPDAQHRWMGSIGMDAVGNIAMGYSVSSSNTFPSIRMAGRLAGDPAGEMAQGEATLMAGSGSQTDNRSRWGDYSAITIDPTDDCTFWYTNEYIQTTGLSAWRTRIGSFKFPNCVAGPAGTITGTVTDAGTGAPISGAKVSAGGGITTTTDGAGAYSLAVPVGTYDLSAAKYAYLPQSVRGVQVGEGQTATVNFPLQLAPTFTVSGTVRDAAGDPVSAATVSIPGTPIQPTTTGADGTYAFADVPQATYQATAVGRSRCLDPQTRQLVVAGNTTLDFTLPPHSDAFGYFCREETANYIEASNAIALTGDDSALAVPLPFSFFFYGRPYNTAFVSTNGLLNFISLNTAFTNAPIPSVAAPNAAIYAFWDDLVIDASSSVRTQALGTAPARQFVIEWRNVRSISSATPRWDFEVVLSENGQILIQYRNIGDDGRARGNSATIGIENETGTVASQYSVNEAVLPVGASAIRYRIPPSAVVQGTVIDANDTKPVVGATVTATADGQQAGKTTTDANGRYLIQLRLGSYQFEASASNYEKASRQVNLDTDGAIVTADLALRTARVTGSPESFSLVVPEGETRTRSLTLSNDGSANATFDLATRGGGPAAAGVRIAPASPDVLYDNGPFVTRPGAGPGGSDLSELQTALGLDTFGMNASTSAGFRLADDFTVDGGWEVDTIKFYTYQTGSPTTSTITSLNYRIWDGPPGEPGSNVVFGDTTTNRLLQTAWSNAFRVLDTGADTQRPIMFVNAAAGFELAPGRYWIDWQIGGSLASGPWVPPVTIPGRTTTGDGIQFDPGAQAWIAAVDGGLGTPQGLPFTIEGEVAAGPSWLHVDPTSGTIATGQSANIAVTIDTTGVEPGIYDARIVVGSNSARRPRFDVPVRLVVPAYQQGVNAGGAAYVDSPGDTWAPDRAYTAGSWGYTQSGQIVSTNKPIAGTDDDVLYQRARRAPGSYRFDNVPDGTYRIDLRFAEIQPYQPGKRIVDVAVNGQYVLTGYDIARKVGTETADDYSFDVKVTGGRLEVVFEARRGQQPPLISALRVTERPDL